MEPGALAEFGGIQKKVKIWEWLNSTPVWVDRLAQKEEGLRKSDGHNMQASPSGRGGGRYTVFNHGVDPQMRIMEKLGYMTGAARLENLRIPLAADGGEICLLFLLKGRLHQVLHALTCACAGT